MKGKRIMSDREINQIEIFEKLSRKEIKQKKASKILDLSVRQIKRKLRKYRLHGAKSLIHKNRGKTSNNKISQIRLDKAMTLIKDEYTNFGPTLASEYLSDDHQLIFSVETIRKEMIKIGIWKSRKKRKPNVHQLRERRACFGELVQLDGSPHDWFEGRNVKCNLNVAIDDATNTSMYMFSNAETTQDYFVLVEQYILKYGLPLAFYVDKHATFRVNNPSASYLKKPGNNKHDGLTQFGRAMKELGIELIYANTAQAKGRVERINKTLQDRLVKEMRLKNITSMKEANIFLSQFISKFNKKFYKKPKSRINMHRKLDAKADLSKILCIKEIRTISKNLTFQYNNTIFQIKTKRSAFTLRKTMVTICARYDGTTIVFDYKKRPLKYTVIKKLPSTKTTNSKMLNSKLNDILIKQAKKQNPWESSSKELQKDISYYNPKGAW